MKLPAAVALTAFLTGCTTQGAYVSGSELAGYPRSPATVACEARCRTTPDYGECVRTCPDIVFKELTCGEQVTFLCVPASQVDGAKTARVLGVVALGIVLGVALVLGLGGAYGGS